MIALDLHPALDLTDGAFEQLCRSNPDLRLERTARGEPIAMSPAGSDSSNRNADLIGQLWLEHRSLGIHEGSASEEIRQEAMGHRA